MSENYDKPNYECSDYQAMREARKIVNDVEAGTLHLRKQGVKYLPMFPAENEKDYEIRRANATLFNAYNRTRNGLLGMIFKKNPKLEEDVPARIKTYAENIDLAGTHLDIFIRQATQDAFDGHSFILVDMQKSPDRGKRGRVSQEDVNEAGLRPYWVKYKACDVPNWMPVIINGQLEIGQITFKEEVSEVAGKYGMKAGCQYRTFTLVETSDLKTGATKYEVVWELKKKFQEDGKEEYYEVIDAGRLEKFSRIPVAVVYGRKTGFLTSQPLLLDLALINVKYYQKRSEYDTTLRKAGFPIPVFIGRDTSQPVLTAGPGSGIDVPLGGDAKYMEPEGKSLEAARFDMQDLRDEMGSLGLSVISSRPNVQATATETVIDFTQESSELEMIARSAADAVEQCLGFTAQHIGEKEGGSVILGTHLKSLKLTTQQVTAYSQLVAEQQLPVEVFWQILQEGDALPDDFNFEEALNKLFGKDSGKPQVVRDTLNDPARAKGNELTAPNNGNNNPTDKGKNPTSKGGGGSGK